MRKLDKVEELIIHCSATHPNMDVGVDEIRRWHVEGNGWDDIGYHMVIRRDGLYENGRSFEFQGAHCKGHNKNSLGLCLVGGVDPFNEPVSNFNSEQWVCLHAIVKVLMSTYPGIKISGHNEYSNKACPSFDVQEWLEREFS